MRILVVDDEKIKRVTLADDLATQGHEVETACDGREAIGKLSTARFDVVVTDLKMPNIDGIELLKRIKQGPLADTVVVMMTAYGSIEVAVEAVKLGAFDFVTSCSATTTSSRCARIERASGRRPPKPRRRTNPAARGLDRRIDHYRVAVDGSRDADDRDRRPNRRHKLLLGETGVGKDLIASVIHRHCTAAGSPT